MAQGYYTLEEAAGLLGMGVDELKALARRGDIRSFQDRGTWRFRVQDIQEMARQRGLGSEPDLALGESLIPLPKKPSGLKRTSDLKKTPAQAPEGGDESIGIGQERLGTGSSAARKSGIHGSRAGGTSPAPAPKSPAPSAKSPAPGPKSPTPKKISKLDKPEPGSDSDVRLVSDDPNMDFGIEVDSDVRLGGTPPPGPKSSGKMSGPGKSGLGPKAGETGKRRTSEVHPSPPDSGVRLVPMDSDSDVRIVGADGGTAEIPAAPPPSPSASDSDIRLEFEEGGHIDPGMLTDEIDLDAELRKQQGQLAPRPGAPTPEESPFELSDSDFQLPSTGSSLVQAPEAGSDSGSSDFDLSPGGESSSPLDSSAEFELPLQDDSGEIPLGDAKAGSGITLGKPLDSGISLEQSSEGSDEFEIGLSKEKRHKTPPAKEPQKVDSDSSDFELDVAADDSSGEMSALEDSSEFELAMDAGASAGPPPATEQPDSSEFELTLDVDESSSEFELTIDASGESAATPDLASDSEFELQLEDAGLESSSEFELTIDDDLQLVPEEDATPQIHMDEDIVQTDLDDVPLLEEDTGSDVVALDEDTGLEVSDFDIEVEDDSSSQVVALEEDLIGAEVGDKGVGLDFEEAPYDQDLVQEQLVEREPVIIERDVYAAPWSAWPVIVMLPCVLVMFFIGLMGFELVQSMNGYQEPGTVTKAIVNLTGVDRM